MEWPSLKIEEAAKSGIILRAAVLQVERRISRSSQPEEKEIPPPTGENAGVRRDAAYKRKKFRLNYYLSGRIWSPMGAKRRSLCGLLL